MDPGWRDDSWSKSMYSSRRTPVQFQEDLPPLASADTCTHMHIRKNNILEKFKFNFLEILHLKYFNLDFKHRRDES